MPASPIRKLVPFAEAAKARGTSIYHLNIGQPDINTPEVMLDAIRSYDEKVVAYSHSAGLLTYRQKIVKYYKALNLDIGTDDIIVSAGASEAILFAVNSCLDAGDELIVPEPFYANYNGFSISAGVKVVPVTAHIETGFALPAIEDFELLINEKTKGIMICNPSNPTGYVYSREELEILSQIVQKHDLFLFVDEVYREFCYDGREHVSVLSLPGLEENVVVFDSISKRYSACGARIGYMISKNQEVISTAMKFAQARLSPPGFGQVAASACMEVPASYLENVLNEYDQRRRVLVEELRKIPGVICPEPGGAFYAFVQLPIENAEHFCRWLLEDFSHEGSTVMLAPGSGFYSTPGSGRNQVRIAYVLNVDDLKRAVAILAAGLERYTELQVETA